MLYYWETSPVSKTENFVTNCVGLDKKFFKDALKCDSGYYENGLQYWYDKEKNSKNTRFCQIAGIPYTMYQVATRTSENPDTNYIVIGRLEMLHSGKWVERNGKPLKKWSPKSFSVEGLYNSNNKMLSFFSSHPIVMYIANLYWSLLANDAWLLGGVNSHTDFRIVSPLTWENLWNEKEHRMTVTARELIGITSFGYKIRPSKNKDGDQFEIKGNPQEGIEEGNMVAYAYAECIDKDLASSASLIAYKENVQRFIRDGEMDMAELEKFYKKIQDSLAQG
jgi:hypothetical protein